MRNRVTKFSFLALVVACASLSSAGLLVDYTADPNRSAAVAITEESVSSKQPGPLLSVAGIGGTLSLGLLGLLIKPE